MARVPTSVKFLYDDDVDEDREVEITLDGGLTMGQLIDRITNGAVTPEDYLISRNGNVVDPNESADCIQEGDHIAASSRKNVGA